AEHGIALDATSPADLTLFPEMDSDADAAEVRAADWGPSGSAPDRLMCGSSRMVIKRKGSAHPTVAACTLIPYDPQFELGRTLREAARDVPLNHPHCAQFCVFGGASCSPRPAVPAEPVGPPRAGRDRP